MKLTPWMLSIAAFLIIVALAVGFVMKKAFAKTSVRPAAPAMQVVPMAMSDIQPGTTMQAAFLGDGPTLAEHRDMIRSRDAIIGRVAKEPIPMATPLRLSMFYPIGSGPEVHVAPGNRLISVSVGGDTGIVSGLVKPDTHVDVMMTVDGRSNDRQTGEAMVRL